MIFVEVGSASPALEILLLATEGAFDTFLNWALGDGLVVLSCLLDPTLQIHLWVFACMVRFDHSDTVVSRSMNHRSKSVKLKSVVFIGIGLEFLVKVDETWLTLLTFC